MQGHALKRQVDKPHEAVLGYISLRKASLLRKTIWLSEVAGQGLGRSEERGLVVRTTETIPL